ncbi:hypothetical protein EG68_09818 [Paragonimus skrjabini miyazakii]|uniref:Uncharacterized protein n=1 Tax=Paragonimus skrjabini miyazakii TaxID=59628 RepID=A0A8S9YHT5_9TREM|nr:hypothetical protein EG68_09818 [Paragonimus skrjabini miyazakii]
MVCGHETFCHIFSSKENMKFSTGHVYAYSCVACLSELVCNHCISRSDKQQYLRRFYELSKTEYLFVDKLENTTGILLNTIDMLAIDLNSDYSNYVDTVMAVLQFFFKLLSASEDSMLCGINSIFTHVQLDSTTLSESHLINSIILTQKVLEIADTSWNDLPNKICEFFIMLLSSKFENVIVACFQGLVTCCRSPAFFQSIELNIIDRVVDAIITLRKNIVAVNKGVTLFEVLLFGFIEIFSELHDILEVFGSHDEWNISSLLPQVLDRFINVIKYLSEKNSLLILKYCTLLCENIRNYRGAVDLFMTSQMQEKFLLLIKELLLSHNIHVCLSAITCISLIMRYDRFIRPVPVLLTFEIIQAASKAADYCLLLKSGSKEDTTTNKVTNDIITTKQKLNFLNLYVEFCCLVHQKFLLEKKVDMSDYPEQCQHFSELFVRLFFGRYLEGNITLSLASDETFMQSFTHLLSLYCVSLMQGCFKKTLVNMQVGHVKVSMGTIFDPDTKRLIRGCFTCVLPLFYRFCFTKKNLLRSKSLLSSKDTFIHTERNLERSLSTLPKINSIFFIDECIYLELIALMTLIEATKVYEGYGHKLKDDGEADESLQTFRILKQGASFIQAADYYSLAEHLRGDSNNFSLDHVPAAALGITCTLMNRSIKFLQHKVFPNCKAYYEDTECHYGLTNRPCVPETLLEQLLLFPVKAGVAYFSNLPVFFTIQLLLTYTVSSEIQMDRYYHVKKFIQTFENHFLTRLDVSPVERKMTLTSSWNILASALIDHLTPHRTQLLLRCPGFSAQLQRADLVWVKLAQQMIMHCHWDDELYEQDASELLHKSYMSAANIWTVWVNTFIKGENALLLKRLTATLEKMLVALQNIEELSEEIRLSRREFTFYVADSLASLSAHLPCTLTEFLTNRDVYLDTYVEILRCFTEALIKELCVDAPRALRWIQLIFELLSNVTCLKDNGTRHRLLKLILCFLINSEDRLLAQVVKLLCSSLCVHDTLHCFYVEAGLDGNEGVLSFHAQRHSISPEELENIMCIGAIVTGCSRALPPVQFSNQFDKAIFCHSEVVLDILKSSVPSLANTQKIQAAALLCLLHSSDIPGCGTLWPSCDSEEHVNYYCKLFSSSLF